MHLGCVYRITIITDPKYSDKWTTCDKINKMSVRPVKTQISLGIRWSQADLSLSWAHSHFVVAPALAWVT